MISVTGTVRKNSRSLPEMIKSPGKLEKHAAVCKKGGNLLVLVWKDKKLVLLLSNLENPEKNPEGIPQMIQNYKKVMGGVDRGDQFSSFYLKDHKCFEWWHRIFISLLDICLMNSYILYKEQKKTDLSQLEYPEQFIKLIFEQYLHSRNLENMRNIHQFHTESNKIIPNLHRIETRTQMNCIICSTKDNRNTATYYCVECDKSMAPDIGFYIYQTKMSLKKRNKDANLKWYDDKYKN